MEDLADRAAGAVMGALIGDALGLGPHWYYDLEEQYRDYGTWITGYTNPKKDRYHGSMRAGQLSQSGLILNLLLKSVVENNDYNEQDFTRRLEEDLFPFLDGTPMHGPGGYTNQSIREAYRKRIEQKLSWKETGGGADTTEAAERGVVLAAFFARAPRRVAETVRSNCALTQSDGAIVAMTTAFNSVVAALVRGEKLDVNLSDHLMRLVKKGDLPFHSVTGERLTAPRPGEPEKSASARFSSPDALLTPSYMAEAAADSTIRIEPAWKVSIVYGMPCAIYHQLPAAYYLAARFQNDFESAVLHALNGGGQNMSRACLTGALVGAQVGLSKIPSRFITGLEDREELMESVKRLVDSAQSFEF
jgi:ADP-ribosylglycohydrolase